MTEGDPLHPGGIRASVAEVVVAAFLALVAAIVIGDSLRLGVGWGSDGPQSGYFPFYVGLILLVVAVCIALRAVRHWFEHRLPFAGSAQLAQVGRMFVPMVGFVCALPFLGLYLAGAVYIAAFMRWQGRFPVGRCVLVGIAVALVLFALFELWFHVPLPKGPIERWLGY